MIKLPRMACPSWCTRDHTRDVRQRFVDHATKVGTIDVSLSRWVTVQVTLGEALHEQRPMVLVVSYTAGGESYAEGRSTALWLSPGDALELAGVQECLGHAEFADLLRSAAVIVDPDAGRDPGQALADTIAQLEADRRTGPAEGTGQGGEA